MQQPILPEQQLYNDHRRKYTRGQRRNRGPFHPHMKTVEQNRNSRQIHTVHQKRHLHGNPGVSHDPKYSGSRVVQRDKRNRRADNQKEHTAVFHDVRLNLSEHLV